MTDGINWRNRIVRYGTQPADQFVPNPRNPRKHPKKQREAVAGSLGTLGWIAPVVVNVRTGYMIDGHERVWQATKDNAEVPFVEVDLSEDEEALALATFDWITYLAEYDHDRLDALLKEVHTDDQSLQALIVELAESAGLYEPTSAAQDPGAQIDRAEELRRKWQTELGQFWIIPSANGGEHRLLCGDSTNPEDVARVMNGNRAVLFATDPPYLVDYDGNNHPHKWNEAPKDKDWSKQYKDWDRATQGEGLYDGFIKQAVELAITENAAWYCWHASRRQAMLESVWEKYGAFVHEQIIWAKNRPVLTRSWYMWQHEPCFFGWVKGHKPDRVASDFLGTVWQIDGPNPGEKTDHPTSKPTELFAIPMRQHTRRGDICYEPFTGSGSQVVAAEQEGRLVYGLELQPEFVAVILERMEGMGLEPRLTQ